MRTLTLIQLIFAIGLILVGIVTLFGIGITGLIFLVPGLAFAATVQFMQTNSRVSIAIALAGDVGLAYVAARKLQSLRSAEPTYLKLHDVGAIDYVLPFVVILLAAIGASAVVIDWRNLRNSRWF